MDETKTIEPQTVVVLGVPFHNITFQEAVAWTRQRIQSRRPGYIATANMDFVMQAWRDPELRRILLEADLVVADGIPIVWLSALLGPRLKARVTGSDLVPMFAEMARDNDFSLFHLGAAPGVAERAAASLVQRFPGLRIAGCFSPPKADVLNMNHTEILARLQAAQPDLLFVAFGAPKQEKFSNMHVRRWKVPVAMGVGGSLDFLAGAQKRAPRWVQRLALEWLWRMLSDPPRLFRRYVGNLAFFFLALFRLLAIRCRPDRRQAPLPDDSELRRMAHVETYAQLSEAAQAQAFCTAIESKAVDRSVVLDMSGVPWLSSLELGALLRLTTALRQRQQSCILAGVGSRVRRLLTWCRLAEYLEVGSSPEEVVAKIREWNVCAQQGSVHRDSTGRILIRLPMDLTAANLDAFKALVAACLDFDSGSEWTVMANFTRFVDSSALGYFMSLKKRANAQGVALRFTGVRPAVRQTFRLAKLESALLEP